MNASVLEMLDPDKVEYYRVHFQIEFVYPLPVMSDLFQGIEQIKYY